MFYKKDPECFRVMSHTEEECIVDGIVFVKETIKYKFRYKYAKPISQWVVLLDGNMVYGNSVNLNTMSRLNGLIDDKFNILKLLDIWTPNNYTNRSQ